MNFVFTVYKICIFNIHVTHFKNRERSDETLISPIPFNLNKQLEISAMEAKQTNGKSKDISWILCGASLKAIGAYQELRKFKTMMSIAGCDCSKRCGKGNISVSRETVILKLNAETDCFDLLLLVPSGVK